MKSQDEPTWYAYGENCMPINVLRRHKKNSPSTPFSAGRSDIEHIEYFERTGFKEFVDPNYIIEANAFNSNRCYLNIASKSSGSFKPGRHRYVEFTHHNPLEKKDKETLSRRVKRMINARKADNKKYLLYFHRGQHGFKYTKGKIKSLANSILDMYNEQTRIVTYAQTIVKDKEQRGVSTVITSNCRVIFFELKTLNLWAGYNKKIFFGKGDDDLFKLMFKRCEEL